MKNQINEEHDRTVLEQWGKSFIRLPRKVTERMFSQRLSERRLGRLHFTLIIHCFHTDGYAILNNRPVPCRRGEYVGSVHLLHTLTDFPKTTIRNLLQKLEKEGWIVTIAIRNGIRVLVNGYHEFMGKEPGQKNKKKQETSAVPTPATPADAFVDYMAQFRK